MSIEVTVRDPLKEDSNPKKVFLTQFMMDKLGTKKGDVVLIKGLRESYGLVFPDPFEDGNGEKIGLNSLGRLNCGTMPGSSIQIKKAKLPLSSSCILVPNSDDQEEAETIASLDLSSFIREKMLMWPLSLGDVVRIKGINITGSKTEFRVENIEPGQAAVINNQTDIQVIGPGDFSTMCRGKTAPVKYDNIGGHDELIEEIREIVEIPLRNPNLFKDMGISPPKGILLYGPPGTGKTLIARALANESKAKLFTIRGAEIIDSHYGEAERRLREVFDDASEEPPSIILLDEIDSIAPKREQASGDLERRVVTQLITLMDSLPEGGGVIVIGTSNRHEAIEGALRRAGRFDREIEIPPPNEKERLEILKIYSSKMPLDPGVDLQKLSRMTVGYVGADLKALCREAAMNALRPLWHSAEITLSQENRGEVNVKMDDFRNALKRIMPTALRETMVKIPDCSFLDIGGLEKVKRDLRECVEKPFTHHQQYKRLGIKTPNGVLLFGPPGTGKTLLARAISNQARSSFISIKAPEILTKLVGEAEKKLREIFQKARQVAPCIIFFDEVDSITRTRSENDGPRGNQNITNQLLLLLDGIERYDDVIVIAATNRPNLIDRAFLRKGRFDRLIFVPPPNTEARKIIFGIHTRNIPISQDVDLRNLAKNTKGFSGADIEGICQEAAIEAFRENPDIHSVSMDHFMKVLKRFKPSIDEETIKYYNSINKEISGRLSSGDIENISLIYN